MGTFSLNEKELSAATQFKIKRNNKNRKKKKYKNKRATFSYIFGDSSGIGISVIIRDNLSGKEKDITDYSSW